MRQTAVYAASKPAGGVRTCIVRPAQPKDETERSAARSEQAPRLELRSAARRLFSRRRPGAFCEGLLMSVVGDLVAELKRRAIGRALSSKEKYLRLVAAAVAGRKLDVDDVDRALVAAHKSHEDFEADCRAGLARIEARKTIAKAEQAQAKLRDLERRSDDAVKAFEQARQAFDLAAAQINADRGPLEMFIQNATSARAVLHDTAPAELLAEQRRLGQLRGGLVERLQTLEKQLEAAQLSHDGQTMLQKALDQIKDEEARGDPESRAAEIRHTLGIGDARVFAVDRKAALQAAVEHLRTKREPKLREAKSELARLDKQLDDVNRKVLEA